MLETDGYLLDRFKTFYAGEYGVLTFVEDHGLIENCDAAGNGDSGLYPGAGADTGEQRDPHRPERRYSQEIRHCDSHHNTLRLLGHGRQRRLASTTTTSTTTRSASRPTSSRRPATPASRRTPT